MTSIPIVLVGLAAVFHALFMILEMFLWESRWGGGKILNMTPDQVKASAPLAKNQGLYNGFLAVGMAYFLTGQWGAEAIGVFCLGCGIIAGLFGGVTVKPSFLLFQALPSGVALLSILLSW